MAYGEQFGSRQVVHGPDGATGTRIFLVPYAQRYAAAGVNAIPRQNDGWAVATDARLDADEDLWVHSIAYDPYAASSTAGSKEAATECRVTVTYRGWPLDLSIPTNWIVSGRQIVQATETGQELAFATSKNKVPKRAGQLVSLIEFTIIGEEEIVIAGGQVPTAKCIKKVPGVFAQGTVCAEPFVMGGLNYVDNDAKLGALLFEGQSLSAPYARRGYWYRKFERSILWRAVLETVGVAAQPRRVLGGHLLQWDASAGGVWDTTDPPLYPTTGWTTGADWIVPPGVLR